MKKKLIITSLLLCFALVGCAGKGVSIEEYNKVVNERDELQAQLDALTNNGDTSESKKSDDMSDDSKEYKIGETWEVDGLFKVTVNSVVESDYRNEFDESNPEAVYIITYTYENLGLSDDLYVDFESQIVDNGGKMGTSYPGDYELYPQSVPIGANCEAQACIAVENPGSFKDYVEIYDDDYNLHEAVFNLDIQ